MATFDVLGPSGFTLTADLYIDRTDTLAATDVALTEDAERPGWYRGAAALSGWYQAAVSDATSTVAWWDLFLSADHVAVGYDRPDSLFPPAVALTSITLPIPSAEQFVAYVICRSADGTVQADITVHCAALSVTAIDNTGSAWALAPQSAVSDAQGLCSFFLPKNTGLRFKAWRETGNARLFALPAGASEVQIPDLIG